MEINSSHIVGAVLGFIAGYLAGVFTGKLLKLIIGLTTLLIVGGYIYIKYFRGNG